MSKNNYLWKFEDKIWKILNKVFRANYYNPIHKPQWLSLKMYLSIRKIYENRVEKPYAEMVKEKIKEDFSKNPKLQKFEKYF